MNMYWTPVFLLLFLYHTSSGQTARIINGDTVIIHKQDAATTTFTNKQTGKVETFTYIEQMPEPSYDIKAYLANNMRYPEDAKQEGVSGKVIVKFIIRANGSIDSAYVARGIYPSVDKEALRLITGMPPWKPGILNGKPVDVHYIMPVIFKLE